MFVICHNEDEINSNKSCYGNQELALYAVWRYAQSVKSRGENSSISFFVT